MTNTVQFLFKELNIENSLYFFKYKIKVLNFMTVNKKFK